MDTESFVLAFYFSVFSDNRFCCPFGLGQSFPPRAHLLRITLPLLGLFCFVTVAIAIRAAERVRKPLGNRRAFLSMYINDRVKGPGLVPVLGSSKALRDNPWTLHHGSLPHIVLPWVFAALWLLLLMSLGL